MFDVGFSELVVIGLVALIVFGPEELPRVARTVGHLMGKMRRYVSDVKADISREMEMADLQRMKQEVTDAASEIQNSINDQARALQQEFQQATASVAEVGKELEALPQRVAEQESVAPVETVYVAALPEPVVTTAVSAPSEVTFEPAPIDAAPLEEVVPVADDRQLDMFGMPIDAPAHGNSGGKA